MVDKYEEILKKDAFRAISPDVKRAFKQLLIQIEGKGMTESMAAIMKFSQSMPKGKPLSREEQNAMKQAMLESLNNEDKMKFQKLLQMLDMMNK
jgi:hypothetical protein